MTVYEYGYYNDLKKDREFYTDAYKKRGFKNVTVKRVKTDTKGLHMYEITLKQDLFEQVD